MSKERKLVYRTVEGTITMEMNYENDAVPTVSIWLDGKFLAQLELSCLYDWIIEIMSTQKDGSSIAINRRKYEAIMVRHFTDIVNRYLCTLPA